MIDIDRDDDAPENPPADEAAHTQAAIPPGLERAEQLLRAVAGPPRPISGPPPLPQQVAPRFYRRRWFVGLLTLLFLPLALLIMWTGPVFHRRRGELRTMPLAHKWLVTSLFGLLVLVRLVTLPHHVEAGDAPVSMSASTMPVQSSAAVAPIEVAAVTPPTARPQAPLITIQASPTTNAPIGPSFDCAKARDGVGATICSDVALRRLDLEFVQAYQALRQELGEAKREALRQDAVAFHQYVLSTCNLPRTVTPGQRLYDGITCVTDAYRAKRADYLKWLQGAALQEASRDIVQHLALQGHLVALGILPAGTPVDGVYGPGTREAIARLQGANDFPVTGLMSDGLATALTNAAAATTRSAPPSTMPSFVPQGPGSAPALNKPTAPILTPAEPSRPTFSDAAAEPAPVKRPPLPACDSRETKATLAYTLRNSASTLDRLVLVEWSNVRQAGETRSPQARTCTATLYLNSGETPATFRLFYPAPTSTTWLMQVNWAAE